VNAAIRPVFTGDEKMSMKTAIDDGLPRHACLLLFIVRRYQKCVTDDFGRTAVTRWRSASQLFVANNVSSFAANIRKLVYSLWRTLNASDNVLISAVLRSDLLARSPVLKRWRNIQF